MASCILHSKSYFGSKYGSWSHFTMCIVTAPQNYAWGWSQKSNSSILVPTHVTNAKHENDARRDSEQNPYRMTSRSRTASPFVEKLIFHLKYTCQEPGACLHSFLRVLDLNTRRFIKDWNLSQSAILNPKYWYGSHGSGYFFKPA